MVMLQLSFILKRHSAKNSPQSFLYCFEMQEIGLEIKQDGASSVSRKPYTLFRFDVNLEQPNQEPYPWKGKSLIRAAKFLRGYA